GFSLIDVISPCVTFNNNAGSTKSYDFVREYVAETSQVDFVPHREELAVDYAEESEIDVTLFDGSQIRLSKPTKGWDPTNRLSAVNMLNASKERGEIATGLIYINTEAKDLHGMLNTTDTPLNQLSESDLTPAPSVLADINASFK
ncbi:MAG: 2-oxoglutarate ferredoxin oxidoreductase subunit beta, partial [Saprospiraceae bacterium]